MATYTNEKRPKRLREGDTVVFSVNGRVFEYEVAECFLHQWGCGETNDAIFDVLGLNKNIVSHSSYGYYSCGGSWPESRGRDFAALCRLVNALYAEIDKQKVATEGAVEEDKKPKLKFKVGDVVSGKSLRGKQFKSSKITTIDYHTVEGISYFLAGIGWCREEDIHLDAEDGTKSESTGDTIILPKDFPPEFKEFIEFIVNESNNIRTIAYGVTERDGCKVEGGVGKVGYYTFDGGDRPYDALGIAERLRHVAHTFID